MDSIIGSYLHARETITRLSRTEAIARFLRGRSGARVTRGQTMTEYALIIAAVAIAVYTTYQTMGTTIQSMVSSLDAKLTAAVSS
jgi:Flp pilus assembly pilin Flp